MSRERGFLDPPSTPDDPESHGFLDPIARPRWIVVSPPIRDLPEAAAILAALDRLAIGVDP
jgi:hypothetical protein